MDKSQAYLILGFNHNDKLEENSLRDGFEEAVFKEVTFFMRRSFLPALAISRIKKLHDIDSAAKALDLDCDLLVVDQFISIDLDGQCDLLSLLSAYHSQEAALKSILANATIPLQAVSLYNQWISLFTAFAQQYIALFQGLNVESTVNKEDIRISENVDFNDLYNELKALDFSNLASREFYRLQKLIEIY